MEVATTPVSNKASKSRVRTLQERSPNIMNNGSPSFSPAKKRARRTPIASSTESFEQIFSTLTLGNFRSAKNQLNIALLCTLII